MKILHNFFPSLSKFAILVFVALSISSCRSAHDKALANIESLRKAFHDAPTNAKRIDEGVKLDAAYQAWIKNYPTDSLSPEYAFRDAQVEAYIKNTTGALKMYASVYTDYPQNKRAPVAMMAAGNIYDEVVMDKQKAKGMYKMIIDKYPNDTMAVQAKQLLIIEDMGIENFLKQKMAEDSAQKAKKPM